MKFHGNVRGEVRVNFLALFASKPHIFMCGALKLSGIVRANFCLNIAIAMLLLWGEKTEKKNQIKEFGGRMPRRRPTGKLGTSQGHLGRLGLIYV